VWHGCGEKNNQEELVEIKVGIQHVNREVVMETTSPAADIEKAFADAVESDGVFTVQDEHGRRVMIPATKIAYLDLGEENARRVGFGLG
jgi:hypothetical protein